MRIVLVNSARGAAGGARAAETLSRALAERGHLVTVACHPRSAIRERLTGAAGVTVAPVAIRGELDPVRVWQLRRLFVRSEAQVVIADRRKDAKLAAVAARPGRLVPVVHRHGAPSPLRDGLVYRWIWGRWLDGLVVNSHAMEARLRSRTPWIEALPTRVIHNGVDAERFRPRPARREPTRRALGIPEAACVACFHGVVQPRKRVDRLVRAAAAAGGKVHALVVGDGPALEAVRGLATATGAPVRFAGPRQDPAAVLAAADLAVHMSESEGFSNSVLEALACGLPVVAPRATSYPEQIEHGRHGLLYDPGDAREPAASLRRLCADPAERARMGQAARERARRDFTLAGMAEAWEAFLEEILAARGAGRAAVARAPDGSRRGAIRPEGTPAGRPETE